MLGRYDGERPGVKANLARLLMHGSTGGSGSLVILPVDHGFEHGPAASFSKYPAGYDPHTHFQLAVDAGVSALAAPLGFLATGADRFAGEVPLILKANNGDSLSTVKDQAVTASVRDALELGCAAVGYTIYPGSPQQYEMFEEVREGIAEARAAGLATVVWAYPRGGDLEPEDESALDVVAIAAQVAVQLGAHIVKVKIPTARVARRANQAAYADSSVDLSATENRIAHVVQAAFGGRRLVVFSGGAAKDAGSLLEDARAVRLGGGHGSMVGRNCFQRSQDDALRLITQLCAIYRGESA
jgi:class I fructose-bisphosphate aldolase